MTLDTAELEREFLIEVADTPELIIEAQRLRYQVYCLELGALTSDDGIERDEFDAHARHVVLRRRSDGEVIGTFRIVLYDHEAPLNSYPMQRICDPSLLIGKPTLSEVSRFAISKKLRGASTMFVRLLLIQGLFRVSCESGITHWCAVMENALLRLLKSSAIHFKPLGPMVECYGPRQPCYANIAEVVARMCNDRPDIWDLVTRSGLYYGGSTN
jgi:N-acyl-L-homoserine lactone synthetase